MKEKRSYLFIGVLFLLYSIYCTSCNSGREETNKPNKRGSIDILHIQYREELRINNIPLYVEIADTPEKREIGLMWRKRLEKDCGMIFVYPSEQELTFYMKNCHINLSIAFVNKEYEIVYIQEMKAQYGVPDYKLIHYQSKRSAKYAIEMAENWFTEHNIHVGDKVEMGKLTNDL
ncbi:MAG: DUF192 domain-containing protein [Nitrospinae bacterium]|nr:DUF192 domain-containing protein [Nitrospinota bacterium]